MEICRIKVYIQKDSLVIDYMVKMTEWLRRWTVNPLGSAQMGSNPIFIVFLIGSIVKFIAICSLDSAIQIKISVEENNLKNVSKHLHGKFTKNKISEEQITNSAII